MGAPSAHSCAVCSVGGSEHLTTRQDYTDRAAPLTSAPYKGLSRSLLLNIRTCSELSHPANPESVCLLYLDFGEKVCRSSEDILATW